MEYENPSEALTILKQVSTVKLYQGEFERLSQQIEHLLKQYLVGCFIAGLKDEIRLEVKIKQPWSLSKAIGVARLIEEKIQLQRRNLTVNRQASATPQPRVNGQTSVGLLGSTTQY